MMYSSYWSKKCTNCAMIHYEPDLQVMQDLLIPQWTCSPARGQEGPIHFLTLFRQNTTYPVRKDLPMFLFLFSLE